MTLVQLLGDRNTVHMCCDFRLTDPYTGIVRSDNAHKLVTIARPKFRAIVGVTGLAAISGRPVGEWIAECAARVPFDGTLVDLLNELKEANSFLRSISDLNVRRHTFAVAAFEGMRTNLVLVSNFEAIVGGKVTRYSFARDDLFVTSHSPRRPTVMLTGAKDAVTDAEQRRLTSALRDNLTASEVQARMQEVNRAASVRTQHAGRPSPISEGSFTSSMDAVGRGSSQPFLTDAQEGDFIPPEFAAVLRSMNLEMRPRLDEDGNPMPIRMVGSTSFYHTPSAEFHARLLRERPNDPEVWNNYGAWLNSKRKATEAASAFERAIELDLTFLLARQNLAQTYWNSGDLDRAESTFKRAVEIAGDSVPTALRSLYASFLGAMGDVVRARGQHDICVEDSSSPVWRARRALHIALLEGGVAESRVDIEQALGEAPNAEVQYIAGRIEVAAGNNEQARDHFALAANLDSGNSEYLASYAQLLACTGAPEGALYYYRRAIRRGASAAFYSGHYGYALLIARKFDQAAKSIRRAVGLFPEVHAHRVNLACCLLALKRNDEAVAVLHDVSPLKLDSDEQRLDYWAVSMLVGYPVVDVGVATGLVDLLDRGIKISGDGLRVVCRSVSRPSDFVAFGEQLASVVEGNLPFSADMLPS